MRQKGSRDFCFVLFYIRERITHLYVGRGHPEEREKLKSSAEMRAEWEVFRLCPPEPAF